MRQKRDIQVFNHLQKTGKDSKVFHQHETGGGAVK
jgi:hypothetical protein